ncbi:hypothetical protein Vi05172_g4022 [Venturia inaequalis]|nr:hypothetical protein Vi05172_g4022 [Venturia inaequalis]
MPRPRDLQWEAERNVSECFGEKGTIDCHPKNELGTEYMLTFEHRKEVHDHPTSLNTPMPSQRLFENVFSRIHLTL